MRKSLLGINMATRFSEADKPFGIPRGLSLPLIRAATVPRLRLWTQALPEIPSGMLIEIHAGADNSFPIPFKRGAFDLQAILRTFRYVIRKRLELKTAIENG